MGEAEALDGRVLIGVTRSVVAAGDSVGTQLHQAERSSRPGKGLALSEFLIGARSREDEHYQIAGRGTIEQGHLIQALSGPHA